MKKILKKLGGIVLVLAVIIVWAIYSYKQEPENILTSSSVVSNTKIGWGVKRAKDYARPDLRKD